MFSPQMILFVALSLLSLVMCADPAGSYCGTYLDVVNVKATVNSLTSATLTGTVFGASVVCKDEAVSYDPTTNVIKLVDITAPNDCVGKLLSDNGVDPSSLTLTYTPSTNVINVAVSDITLTLASCTFPLYLPSGSYCGSYSGATIEATVISLTEISLNATIDTYNIGCATEATKFDQATDAVTFPNIKSSTDCLGSALSSLGIDASGLSVIYNAVANTIHVADGGVSVVLSRCPSLVIA
eukprot:TRINITY_DN16193_c0_g1_i1.p1 TRINITY_DN16193_c0_g1~~TRINITY_DN16193_c0_g1_i1.p1  ORF type:complete len:240 (-),score=26.33 TRINITY_DN16193_c0_g1_i1:90-809(-)